MFKYRLHTRWNHVAAAGAAALLGLSSSACSDDDSSDPAGTGSSTGPLYAVVTQLASSEEALSYLKTLDGLEPQKVDLDDSREFTGLADAWVWEGALYIAEQETMEITKFSVEGSELVAEESVNFGDYGLDALAFWVNAFVSPTKAYVVNGTTEYIVWNPKTMEIEGTVPMPELEEKDGLEPFASYTDRSIAVRDGLFYHPFYYTNDDYFEYAQNSSIAVYDIETDELVRVIDAPCPGLDQVTQDEEGNLYFSPWTYAPAAAALAGQPSACVVKIAPESNEAELVFSPKDATGGLEGGVFRYTGDGKGMLAVFDPDHASEEDMEDPQSVAWGNNWKFWSYDLETQEADENDSIGWNAGSAYGSVIDGKSYIYMPTDNGTDEGGSTIFDISNPNEAKELFTVDGWTMRLIKLR